MPATRNRTRRLDPLASRTAVRAVLAQLQAALGPASPKQEKDFVSLLRATGYAERHPQVTSARGRKSRWSDYDKSRVRLLLTDILARGTKRIALRSFLEHYLLILDFPVDVAEALEASKINLFEAEQLARLTAKRLEVSEAKARQRRAAFLKAHEQAAATGMRLKAKVDAVLQLVRPSKSFTTNDKQIPAATLTASDFDPAEGSESLPPEHLFAEYLRLIGSLLREIRADELSDAELVRVADYAEPLLRHLNAIYKQQNQPLDEQPVQVAERRFFI